VAGLPGALLCSSRLVGCHKAMPRHKATPSRRVLDDGDADGVEYEDVLASARWVGVSEPNQSMSIATHSAAAAAAEAAPAASKARVDRKRRDEHTTNADGEGGLTAKKPRASDDNDNDNDNDDDCVMEEDESAPVTLSDDDGGVETFDVAVVAGDGVHGVDVLVRETLSQ
jgi:hypothetical protein